jgi:small-conductance mechanosensitive channel
MKSKTRVRLRGFHGLLIAFFCLAIILTSAPAIAQNDTVEKPSSKVVSVTTEDPNISTQNLELLVRPLTVEELGQEAQDWLQLLKLKVEEISDAEIAINQHSTRIEDLGDNESSTGLEADKQTLIDRSTELQTERAEIIDRLTVVLDEWALKGGDIEEYEQYLSAVSGVDVNITDTDGLWLRLSAWLSSESGGIRWGLDIARSLFIVLFWLILGWIANRFYNTLHRQYVADILDNQVDPVIKKVVHIAIWGLILIVILSSLGFNISAIIASLGIGGLALALAAQDTVANLFGGIVLLLQKPMAVGDRIEIDGIKAKVVEIGLRTTIIKELEYDYLIYVPNSKFTSSALSNIDTRPYYSNYVYLHLDHRTPLEKIELALDVIKEVAANNKFVRGARPSLDKIGKYSFDIKFVYWINKWQPEESDIFASDLWKIYTVKSQMNTEIMRQFEKHNIKLALPIEIKLESNSKYGDWPGSQALGKDEIELLEEHRK